jgi:hypothetical protein
VRLARLRSYIEQALTEPSAPPIGVGQALSIIRQMVEEQPHRNAYTYVDVSEERISAVREVTRYTYYPDYYPDYYPGYYYPYYGGFHWYRGPFFHYHTTVPVRLVSGPDVVYFNNIGRVELVPSGRWQVVRIWDRYGGLRMRLLSLDETFAKRFVDALGVMEHARREAESAQERPQS